MTTIVAAMKNYLSLRLAEGLVGDGVNDAPPQSAAETQALARAILQAINALEPGAEKATRLHGRELLARPGFYAAVREAVLQQPGLDGAAAASFVDDFERSFRDGVVDPADVELGELVWAVDYAAALRERGARRAQRAAEAAAEGEGGQSQQQLEALVRGGLG